MENKLVWVRNRNNGSTGYTIEDRHLWRNFGPGERKQISLEELQALQYQPGGDYTLKNFLIIEDKEALRALNMEVEPEYNYTEKDIRNLLLNGSLDQLRDFLDFAPDGAIEICKEIAVKEEIPDIRKRDIISESTGFNINSAISVNHIMNDNNEIEQPKEKKERRVAIAEGGKQRRTSVSEAELEIKDKPAAAKYKVIG